MTSLENVAPLLSAHTGMATRSLSRWWLQSRRVEPLVQLSRAIGLTSRLEQVVLPFMPCWKLRSFLASFSGKGGQPLLQRDCRIETVTTLGHWRCPFCQEWQSNARNALR